MKANKNFEKGILILMIACLFAACNEKATPDTSIEPIPTDEVQVDTAATSTIDESAFPDEVTAIPDAQIETYEEMIELPESEPEEIARNAVRLYNISNRQVSLRFGPSKSLSISAQDIKTIETNGANELIVATTGPSAITYRLLPGITYGVFFVQYTGGWKIQKITVRT